MVEWHGALFLRINKRKKKKNDVKIDPTNFATKILYQSFILLEKYKKPSVVFLMILITTLTNFLIIFRIRKSNFTFFIILYLKK